MKDSAEKKQWMILISLYSLCAIMAIAVINRLFVNEILRQPILDILRVCDVNAMFIFAPISVVWLLMFFSIYRGFKNMFFSVIFVLGLYFAGMSFGMHEPSNAIGAAYSNELDGCLLRTVKFMGNQLGHWAFFTGFLLLTISCILAELRKPLKAALTPLMGALLILTSSMMAALIYINMAWEKTSLDIGLVCACLFLTFVFRFLYGRPEFFRTPLTLALFVSYGGGAAATLLHWSVKTLI